MSNEYTPQTALNAVIDKMHFTATSTEEQPQQQQQQHPIVRESSTLRNLSCRTLNAKAPSMAAATVELDSTSKITCRKQSLLRRTNEHNNKVTTNRDVDNADADDRSDNDVDNYEEIDYAEIGDAHNTTDTKDCVDFMMMPSVLASNSMIDSGGRGGGGGGNDGGGGGGGDVEHSIDEPDHLQHRFSRLSTPQHQQQHRNNLHQQQLQQQPPYNPHFHGGMSSNSNWDSFSSLRHMRDDDVDDDNDDDGDDVTIDGCPNSEMSSAISSPAPSTLSSPLSTPTRIAPNYQLQHSHQHCCQKTTTTSSAAAAIPTTSIKTASKSTSPFSAAAVAAAAVACCGGHQQLRASPQHHQHHHHNHHNHNQKQQHEQPHQHHYHHHHHHHHHHNHNAAAASSTSPSSRTMAVAAAAKAAAANGCKKLQKHELRFSPSHYRQLLPIVVCILAFALVFAILIIYMDTTELRHKQFRLNMSRDYDLYTVSQDDPKLIAFLREIHMRKSPKSRELELASDPASSASTASASLASAAAVLNFTAHHDELTPNMAHYVADLVGGKMNGAVIQSLPGALGQLMTAPWLAETLNWAGIIVEPEPRRYFTLRKQNAHRANMQVVHACVSPNTYPKEISIHNDEVRINSLLDEETTWFTSRVKCFPLYSLMRACNRVEYDLLSLGVHGHELQILQTLPFDKVKIEVISIHLLDDYEDKRSYVKSITNFLMGKSYRMQRKFGCNYFYQRMNATSRTRKKDILLLKTP